MARSTPTPAVPAAGVCPRCQGSGWRVESDGGAGRAVRCDCRREGRARELAGAAGIPERYQGCKLDGFDTSVSADKLVNGALMAAKRSCSEFVEGFLLNRKGPGLLFFGPPGVGKTHLAVAVLLEMIERYQVKGRYADFTSLMFAIHSTFDDESNDSLASVLRPVMEAEVLVLDELGAQKPTDWVLQNLYWIVNRRYNERRPTLFTTNYHLDPADAPSGEVSAEKLSARLSPQLVSRLYEMAKPVKMPGFDYRREHRSAQRRPRPKL
jgi:DNA replication protein DnaC